MPEKLMTLTELAAYINTPEKEIRALVDARIIPAYRIGGSYLRFRREQIDVIRAELRDRHKRETAAETIQVTVRPRTEPREDRERFADRVHDFFYFNDFYLIAAAIFGFFIYIILTL